MEHNHHHEHHGHGGWNAWWTIGLAAVLLALAIAVEKTTALPAWQLLLIYLVPYLLVGHETLKEAWEGIASGDAFNEHLLMSVATLGALAIGFLPGGESAFPEAVFVMLFFMVGEQVEEYAEDRSRDGIAHLMDIRPDVARVERDGKVVTVDPGEVNVDEIIVVSPGEKVPLDGVVVEGASSLNTLALTGESLPREVGEDDEVISGCVNLTGVVRVRVAKPFGESTVSQIIRLVEHAGERKSRSEAFITRFARVYTPVVVLAALLLAVLPPLLGGDFMRAFPVWLYRALMFLVVSCPCALVISVPLTFFGGIGGASRRGILIKGANFIDTLARVDTVALDKTGTLTRGQFSVEAVHPSRCDEHRLLHLAAHVEHYSTHPIGAALRAAFPNEATDGCRVTDVREVAGQGVSARVGDEEVSVGNAAMMEALGVEWRDCHHVGTIIHVAINGEYAGHIVINDQVKDEAATAMARLKRQGVKRVVMLTGDRDEVARAVAGRLQVDDYCARMLPADKVARVEQLAASEGEGRYLAFVGDGVNDAPVLARADVGIAMGGLGSDAAIEAADVVLMDDDLTKVPLAIAVARRTLRIARQNVWLAIVVKMAVLALATAGLAAMWMAVVADVGVTLLAVLNALRALRVHDVE